MGNKYSPIFDEGPVGQYAQRLRDRKSAARTETEPRLTFRQMAKGCHYSHATLANACAGKELPNWPVTEAFLRACGADDDEVAEWRQEWIRTQRVLGSLRRKLGEADVVVPTRSSEGRAIREGRLRPIKIDLADPAACNPRPEAVNTFDDLAYELNVLKIANGGPSLRDLYRRMRRMPGGGWGAPVSVTTLSDIFAGRRIPSGEAYRAIVQCLLTTRRPSRLEDEMRPWLEAWSRAMFNHERPDLHRRRGGVTNIFVQAEDQDRGPTASIVAELQPEHAAGLLAGLDRRVAADILRELPPEKAQAVLSKMWQLTGPVPDIAAGQGGSKPPRLRPVQDPPADGDR